MKNALLAMLLVGCGVESSSSRHDALDAGDEDAGITCRAPAELLCGRCWTWCASGTWAARIPNSQSIGQCEMATLLDARGHAPAITLAPEDAGVLCLP